MNIQLGDKARETVTGFEGIAIVRSEYISGCARVGLQPPVGADGKVPDAQHFDEPMLQVVQEKAIAALPSDRGGPRDAPSQHKAPVDMSDDQKIAKAGKLLCVDSGEYSNNSVHGFFVVLQDFEPDAELAMHLEAHPEQLSSDPFVEESYLASLLAKGFLMEVSYGTIHL